MSWYVHENRYGFADGPLNPETFAKAQEMASWLHSDWKAGRKCLSRCQAGLNRSGLVTALTLMISGMSADEAIDTLREKRSTYALCNGEYEHWLLTEANRALGLGVERKSA
mgnify:CR=1 FL=1